jgi:Hpt domain
VHRDTEIHHRDGTVTAPRPPLPGLLAELGDDAWEAVDLALAELADRRSMLIDALTSVNDDNLDRLVDNLRRHAHTVRSTAALLGDDVVVYAATALESIAPNTDVAIRVQRLVDAIGRMIVRWSPIEDASLVRWLTIASSTG